MPTNQIEQCFFPEEALTPFKTQLLKWIGNKQRFAHEIAGYLPTGGRYFEPFVGSGAVLATLAPKDAIASDTFEPLINIWKTLKESPELLFRWYESRYNLCHEIGKVDGYNTIRNNYNTSPNAADLLFLCRSCYGGVVRFRKNDGYMSTPCGAHDPISPDSFLSRITIWRERLRGASFVLSDFEPIMEEARSGDVIYCDPPYSHSQTILYGGQDFDLNRLMNSIFRCKERGVHVALSIDGSKKSGNVLCHIDTPTGLFKREIFVNCGRSMLRRFQMEGRELHTEVVKDRLLLTY